MSKLGFDAYRFSISWSRIFPGIYSILHFLLQSHACLINLCALGFKFFYFFYFCYVYILDLRCFNAPYVGIEVLQLVLVLFLLLLFLLWTFFTSIEIRNLTSPIFYFGCNIYQRYPNLYQVTTVTKKTTCICVGNWNIIVILSMVSYAKTPIVFEWKIEKRCLASIFFLLFYISSSLPLQLLLIAMLICYEFMC